MKLLFSVIAVLLLMAVSSFDVMAVNKADIKIQFKKIRLDPANASTKTTCPLRTIPSKSGSNASSGDGGDNKICNRYGVYESDLTCITGVINTDTITFKAIGGGVKYKIQNKAGTGDPTFLKCGDLSNKKIICKITQTSIYPRSYTIVTIPPPLSNEPVCVLDPRIIITNASALNFTP